MLFLKPAHEGVKVRDSVSMVLLSPAGEWKPDETYWRRRMADGDVVEATPPSETPTVPAKAGKAEPK